MKLINCILILIFCFSSIQLISQSCIERQEKSILLNSGIDGTCANYVARDNISIKPGFVNSQPQIVDFVWYVGSFSQEWRPNLIINNINHTGSVGYQPGFDIDDFRFQFQAFESTLRNELGSSFKINFIDELTSSKATIRISKYSSFTHSAGNGYATIKQNYIQQIPFTAKINQNLVFDVSYSPAMNLPNADTRELDKNLVPGSINGQAVVTPSGAASYSIPLSIPPGLGNMVPKITIDYNSQAGNSLLGWGWNLSGLSAITRVAQTLYSDESIRGVQMDENDKYALDGNRLVVQGSGVYGADLTEYRTEIESFSKIVSHGNTNYGPQSFEVQDKNGIKYYYGLPRPDNDDGRVLYTFGSINTVAAWLIDFAEDPLGNFIIYAYEQDGLSKYIKKISYGCNKNNNTQNYNTIEFFYEKRPDPVAIHYGNVHGSMNRLLYRIVVKNGDAIFRQYDFEYTNYDNTDPFSRLINITESDGIGKRYNPTAVKWGGYGSNIQNTPSVVVAGFIFNFADKHSFSVGDFNGDGRDDIIYNCFKYDQSYNMASEEWQVGCNQTQYTLWPYFQNSTNNDLAFVNPIHISDSYGKEVDYQVGENCKYMDVMPCRITGQSKQDAILPYFKLGPNQTNKAIFYKLNLYNRIGHDEIVGEELTLKTKGLNPSYAAADINNDGYDEIILLENQQDIDNATFQGRIFLPKLNQWVNFKDFRPYIYEGHLVREPTAYKDYFRFFFSDYNGDGLLDMIVKRNANSKIFLNKGGDDGNGLPIFETYNISSLCGYYSCMKPCDFNGDGLQDFILCQRNSSIWSVAINNGNLEFNKVALPNITIDQSDDYDCYISYHETVVIDFNNDGKSDIIVFDLDDGKLNTQWFQSNGTSMILTSSTQRDYSDFIRCATSGDFNGDGRSDLINFGWNCLDASGRGGGLRSYYAPNLNNNAGLVTTIANGLNYKTNFAYKPLTNSTVYTRNVTPAFPLISFTQPLYVVSEMKTDNGLGTGQNSISYNYENALAHLQGKGFMGFAKIIQINDALKIKTVSYFNPLADIETTYYTLTKQTTEVTSVASPTDKPISITENTFGYNLYSGKHIFYHLNTSVTKDLLKAITNTETLTYDGTSGIVPYNGKGNLINKHITLGSDANFTSTEYKEFTNAGSFIENKPQLIETTEKNSTDAAYLTKVRFTYDGIKGYITSKTEHEELAAGKKIITNYTYHPQYGYLTNISEIFPDKVYNNTTKTFTDSPKTLSTSYTNTSDGKFLKTKTEPLGFITEYEYDDVGNLLSEKSAAGFTKRYEYNNPFRSLSKTINHDGTWVAINAGWDGTNMPTNGIYYTTVTASSSAPSVKYFDKLGRELRNETTDFTNKKVFTDASYNEKGQNEWQSLPYYSGTPVKKYFTYDDFGRIKTQYFDDNEQIVTFAYDDYNSTKVTTSYAGMGRYDVKKTNVWGTPDIVTDAYGNTISYKYYSSGQPSEIIAAGVTTSMNYDEYGNQTDLIDPSAGNRHYVYNSIGRLCKQSDDKSDMNTTVLTYDDLGRVIKKHVDDEIITYTYDSKIKGALSFVNNSNGISSEYFYNTENGRLTSQTETINGKIFRTSYDEYNNNGDLIRTTYPSGYIVLNEYDSYGYGNLIKIKNSDGITIWQATNVNASGLITNYTMGNNKHAVVKNYSKYGEITRITTPGVSDLQYDYDPITRNIMCRKNNTKGLTENFTYDDLDRIKSWGIASAPCSIEYDNVKILRKTDAAAGDFHYQEDNFRLDHIDNASAHIQKPENITYNNYNKVSNINEYPANTTTGYNMDITYNENEARKMVVIKKDNNPVLTRYYAFGNFEQEERGSDVRKIDFIAGASAIHVNNGGQDTIYYIHTDHQGSWLAVTNNRNTTIKEQAFDPWGRRRNPTTWQTSEATNGFPFSRGYTGHEHMNAFGLINMNGRVFDPAVGMFLSPDYYVQNPTSPQNFNRFAYCYNNPLKYTDPSGDFFWMPFLYTVAQAGLTNFLSQASQGNINSFGNAISAFGIGAFGSAAGYYSSKLTSNIGGALGGTVIGGITNGLTQGITDGLNTLNSGDGFSGGFRRGAIFGGISGGISGGLLGYSNAKSVGANPWTGVLVTEYGLDLDLMGSMPEIGSFIPEDGYLDCLVRHEYGYGVGDFGMEEITANKTPKGYTPLESGLFLNKSNGTTALGVTRHSFLFKTSKIYLSSMAATHPIIRLEVIGHEMVHAWQMYYSFRFHHLGYAFYTEHDAHSFSVNYLSSVPAKYRDVLVTASLKTSIDYSTKIYSYSKYVVMPPFYNKTWSGF